MQAGAAGLAARWGRSVGPALRAAAGVAVADGRAYMGPLEVPERQRNDASGLGSAGSDRWGRRLVGPRFHGLQAG